MRGPEKIAALEELSRRHGCGWVEYREEINQPLTVLNKLDLERLKTDLWFPHTVEDNRATIVACNPSPALAGMIKSILGVESVEFLVTLPHDLVRIIEHNQDVNHGFPASSGRTPLALVRTHLAGRRSLFAYYRTLLAKSRTGLAFIRTGISCVTIALFFIRVFGHRWLLLLEGPLLAVGCVMVFDGIKWYLPVRRFKARIPNCVDTGGTGGTTVLTVADEEDFPVFSRTGEIATAAELRRAWTDLSPVMRRRFLASDRTDYAEERTLLACLRSRMAKVRTGLAFSRTGISLASLGFAMIRKFPPSLWMILDLTLIGIGAVMVVEGFLWYAGSRHAGVKGNASVKQNLKAATIWDHFFPHRHSPPAPNIISRTLPVHSSDLPGIWATTGVALERTVLAERRNVMSRLRTVMARARTGFAFIRTGFSLALIGIAFILYFGGGVTGWNIFDLLMVGGGMALIIDGLYWSLPAERTRRQFPYCYGDMEITIPDYGIPARSWRTAVFSNE